MILRLLKPRDILSSVSMYPRLTGLLTQTTTVSFCLCVCVCVCVCVCSMCVQCPKRPKEAIRSPGTEVTGSCELSCGCQELHQLTLVSPSNSFSFSLSRRMVLLSGPCLPLLTGVMAAHQWRTTLGQSLQLPCTS